MYTTTFHFEIESLVTRIIEADGGVAFMKHLSDPQSTRAPLTTDCERMVGAAAWNQMHTLTGHLAPWILDVELHGEGTPTGEMTLTLKGAFSEWLQPSMEAFIVQSSIGALMETVEPEASSIHFKHGETYMEAIRRALRRGSFAQTLRITPHY